jgi:hypothetical protein
MARIRTIKPEICEDAVVAGLSDAAFRLFVSAIVLADDHGNLQGDERWLRSTIWWAHERPPRIAEILRELRRGNLATLYEVRGQRYLAIRGWSKHQRIDNAGKPRVPRPDDSDAVEIIGDESVRGDSPRNSANRGEIPPDLRPPTSDPDPDLPRSQARGEPPSRPRPKTRIPDGWEPNERHRALALERGLRCADEAAAFRDWHASRDSRFADWDAAFRTWLRKASAFAESRSGPLRTIAAIPAHAAPKPQKIA